MSKVNTLEKPMELSTGLQKLIDDAPLDSLAAVLTVVEIYKADAALGQKLVDAIDEKLNFIRNEAHEDLVNFHGRNETEILSATQWLSFLQGFQTANQGF